LVVDREPIIYSDGKRLLMKYLQIILIFGLILFCSYLYIDRKNAVVLLNKKIAVLEDTSKKYQEDCETRIAYLKAEKEREIAKKKIQSEFTSILDIVNKLPENPEKIKKDTLIELVAKLKLDEKMEMQVRAAISDFEEAKGQVFEKCTRENIFILGPVHLSMINEARRDTMGKMGVILTEEQLKAFKDNEFDLKLGLREMKNTADTAR